MSHSSCRVCSENYVTRFSPWVRTSFVWPKFNNGWTWEMTEYPLTHDSNLKLTFLCIKVVEVQFLRTKKSVTSCPCKVILPERFWLQLEVVGENRPLKDIREFSADIQRFSWKYTKISKKFMQENAWRIFWWSYCY